MPSAEQDGAHSVGSSSRKRPPPRGTASYPRKRAITACQVCRARRTKCDNQKPTCGFCLQIGATCIQSQVDLSSFDPASLKILERLDDLEHLLQTPTSSTFAGLPNHVALPTAGQGPIDCLTLFHGKELLPAGTDDILRWPYFSHLSRTSGTAPDALSPGQNSFKDAAALSPATLGADIDVESVGVLVQAFFENVHVKNPVLDEGRIRQLVSRTTLHGFDGSAQSCLALLVCALGAISSSFDVEQSVQLGSPQYLRAKSYFEAAQKRIGPLMVLGGVQSTQCLFLSGVFMATVFNINASWRYFTQALMCCQEFMFQKEAEGNSDLMSQPNLLTSEEQSIYWSTWKSERELRMLLRHEDFPVSDAAMYPPFYPAPPSAPDLTDLLSDDRITQRQNASWYFYLSEISLRRLSTRITQEYVELRPSDINGHLTTLLAEYVSEWEVQIEQWTDGLSEVVSLNDQHSSDDICRWVLRGQRLDVYELIYWPFLREAIAHYGSCTNEGMVASVHTLAQKALETHAQRLEMNRAGMLHRQHGTILMMNTCTRSALLLVLVAAEQCGPKETSRLAMPPRWLDGVQAALHMNQYWQSECPQAGRWAKAITAALQRNENS